MVMDNYYGTNAVELTKASGPLSAHLWRGRATANYCSLVDTRWWLFVSSCTADIGYRTARPIFTKRGPVPFIRDLANHDNDTPRSLATCTGCSRGSSSLVFAGAPMAHLLSCLEMDRRCVWVFRKKSAVLRQIPYRLIPNPIDQNPWAHWRSPMDMMRQGWSTSLFHAAQQWSARSS